ncbi:MAG: CRTAC1 family protein [Phycisphaerae bacterium]|nr:CRTAC1 family protein [Phycisphaerae bacterium]
MRGPGGTILTSPSNNDPKESRSRRLGRRALAVVATYALGAAPAFAGGGLNVTPFSEEAWARGIHYELSPPVQGYGFFGFTCGFADLDRDGDADIITMGSPDGQVGIFENNGVGVFTDRSATSGIANLVRPSACAAGDLNGDGIIDLFLTQIDNPSKVYRGIGGFQFIDVSAGSGTAINGPAKAASLADFDGDGDLDIYVGVYRNGTPGGMNKPSSLFRNNGEFVFTDVAAAQNLAKPAYTFLGGWTDIDLDGDLDLYLSNDRGHVAPFFQGNQLFRNDGGQLIEISNGSGANLQFYSMGLGIGDMDSNGYPDFYCANIANANSALQGKNPLLLNQGNNTFVRGDQQWGVGHFKTSWGTEFFDFDQDGCHDLYVNNQSLGNTLYRGAPSPPALDVSLSANVFGAPPNFSFSSSSSDVDGDGDPDLLVGDSGVNVLLYINHEGDERNGVRIRVVGRTGNPTAIGATLVGRLDAGGPPIFRDIHAGGRSYLGHDMPEAHFGLGRRMTLHEVVVRWPKGTYNDAIRTISNLPANGLWDVYPPATLGDADGDGELTHTDREAFETCALRGFIHGCEMMDFDGDSDIDDTDLYLFRKKASDFDGDGVIGAADLAILLGFWGTQNDTCDLSDNGLVGADDLALLLGLWGS